MPCKLNVDQNQYDQVTIRSDRCLAIKRSLIPLATVVLSTGLAAKEHPEQEQQPLLLPETVVTATRSSEPTFDLPYSIAVVDEQQRIERAYRTTPQALRDIPGIWVQETSQGQGSPYIRGFTGYRTLFMIDGIRLNNSVFRDGPNQYWNTVDPFSVESYEVVKGPQSALYGSDAVGGTVNAVTLNAYVGPSEYVSRLIYSGSSAHRSNQLRVETTGSQDNLSWIGGITGKKFGSLEGGEDIGTQPGTGYDEYDLDLKLKGQFSTNNYWVLAHQRVDQNNVPRTHKTDKAISFKGTTIGSDQQRDLDQLRQLTYLQLFLTEPAAWFDAATFNISLHQHDEVRDRIKSSGAAHQQGFDLDSLGIWGQFQNRFAQHHLMYGFEYYHDDVNSFSSSEPIQGPVGDDATYDLFSLYIQDDLDLTEDWQLILGGRYTYAAADANQVKDPVSGNAMEVKGDWDDVVANVRLLYRLTPDSTRLFIGISQGFRAPNLSDLTRLDSARTNEIETASPDLKPENFLSLETGIKHNSGDWYNEFSIYYTNISDMIVRTPTGNLIGGEYEITKMNAGDGYVTGLEWLSRYQLSPQWSMAAQLSWIDGKVETFPTSAPVLVEEPIDRLMPLTGQFSVRWQQPNQRLWAEGQWVVVDRADKLSTRDQNDTSRIPSGGTPGYGVVNLRAGTKLTNKVQLYLNLNNILNQDYRVHGSGTNAPGRDLALTLEAKI